MKKNIFIIVAALSSLILFTGCNDRNEESVSDGIDFKNSTVTHNGTIVTTDVNFYSDYSSKEFFYYFDHNKDGKADFLIRCGGSSFTTAKESSPGTGLYNIQTFSGAPVVSGNNYHLEFPLTALELDSTVEFTTHYWFYEITEKDRMPDSGFEVLANIL